MADGLVHCVEKGGWYPTAWFFGLVLYGVSALSGLSNAELRDSYKGLYVSRSSYFQIFQLKVKTVLFQTIQFSRIEKVSSIWPIDRTLSDATIPSQSWPGSDGNEWVLRIPQSSSITKSSPLFSVISRTLVEESYPLQRCSRCILQPQTTEQYYLRVMCLWKEGDWKINQMSKSADLKTNSTKFLLLHVSIIFALKVLIFFVKSTLNEWVEYFHYSS